MNQVFVSIREVKEFNRDGSIQREEIEVSIHDDFNEWTPVLDLTKEELFHLTPADWIGIIKWIDADKEFDSWKTALQYTKGFYLCGERVDIPEETSILNLEEVLC